MAIVCRTFVLIPVCRSIITSIIRTSIRSKVTVPVSLRELKVVSRSISTGKCLLNTMAVKTVNYEELRAFLKSKEGILIDVREPSELVERGKIPDSVNIPLGEVKAALTTMPAVEFKSKYGIEKPEKDTKLIFSCHSGRRSASATEEALAAGYLNALSYSGGWQEWESRTKGH